jgi:uncharacterized protein YndB with AHSA1/START domain
MTTRNKTIIVKDLEAKSIEVSREFEASLENVWRAYTESELLDQWWGPSPWRAETIKMNFREGGYWLYAMVGPDNQKQWGKMEYIRINKYERIDITDAFCNEEGIEDPSLPKSKGSFEFTETPHGVLVTSRMYYPSEKDVQTLVDMGFEQGISTALDQLEEVLDKQL